MYKFLIGMKHALIGVEIDNFFMNPPKRSLVRKKVIQKDDFPIRVLKAMIEF